ncbi:uncharacterized protein YMR196W-like isoform X2 [Haliotis rufescens]|nr:uncharacterized protein YMR196W-like isoform X2 [Haliotis rufescens]
MKALYKYPQSSFPYDQLVTQNTNRGTDQPELELLDTGVFKDSKYWDVYVEYAKMAEEDLICCVTVINQSETTEEILVMPQVWFRNTWSESPVEAADSKPSFHLTAAGSVQASSHLGQFQVEFHTDTVSPGEVLFCNNDTRPGSHHKSTEHLETRPSSHHQSTEHLDTRPSSHHQSTEHLDTRLGSHRQSTEHLDTQPGSHRQSTEHLDTQPGSHHPSTEHLDTQPGSHRQSTEHLDTQPGSHRQSTEHLDTQPGSHRQSTEHLDTQPGSHRQSTEHLDTQPGSHRQSTEHLDTQPGSHRQSTEHLDTQPGSHHPSTEHLDTQPGSHRQSTEHLDTQPGSHHPSTEHLDTRPSSHHQSTEHLDTQPGSHHPSTEHLDTRPSSQLSTEHTETPPATQKDNVNLETSFYKDAFHRYIVQGDCTAVNSGHYGSKCAAPYWLTVTPGGHKKIYWSIQNSNTCSALSVLQMDNIINKRKAETKMFYSKLMSPKWSKEEESLSRQAVAGLLWSKQFYLYDVEKAINRSRGQDKASATSDDPTVRQVWNEGWQHIRNSDIIAVPDKWEFPWYAPWDLAFHMIPYIRVDIDFCKHQLELFLTDRYMKSDGQFPGCEFNLSDPNPPLHAWACLGVHRADDSNDIDFLTRCYPTLIRNFEWWMGRLSPDSLYVSGGFLGLDNISVIDRSNTPQGYTLTQADGSAWVALAALNMAEISLHMDITEPSCLLQSKHFLDVFLHIAVQMNRSLNNGGLWHPGDRFYYDVLHRGAEPIPVRLKSLVGLVPLFAAAVIDVPAGAAAVTERLETCSSKEKEHVHKMKDNRYYLSLVPKSRLLHILQAVCDPHMFLSPFGVRSLAKMYDREPYSLVLEPDIYSVRYTPGESDSRMFGGNSNWRGPVWLCMNYLMVDSLDTASEVYGNTFRLEHPTGSGHMASLADVAVDVAERVVALFLPDADGVRPVHASYTDYYTQPGWRHLLLFYEFFHAESGRGCGASHQTGWTALVLEFLFRKHGCR